MNEISIQRALCSLEGLSVADALGQYCWRSIQTRFHRQLPPKPWTWTDDTEMAQCVVAELIENKSIIQNSLANRFGKHCSSHRGYGPAMLDKVLPALREGIPWELVNKQLFSGTGSMGNGSAMRVAPLGAYFAEDVDQVVEEAAKSAEVTHAHPEGISGAIAVALATAFMAHHPMGDDPRAYYEFILSRTPEGLVSEGIRKAASLPQEECLETAIELLGNGSRITCPDTVPFCLWNAIRHKDDYQAAIWSTVKAGGDMDTNAAIVGGIVALSDPDGVPKTWIEMREPLADWFLVEVIS